MRKRIIAAILLCSSITIHTAKHNYDWISTKEAKCLSDNVYYEARGESFAGKSYVVSTVINRTMDDRFPGTICEVVYQPKQFSWTIKKKSKLNRIDMDVMHAYYYGPRVNALYYHNDKVRPKWAKKLNKLKQEGSHTFYK